MGTNYYLLQDSGDDLHIGKSSSGWVFALHVYPELGIRDWEDWVPILAFGEIRDEYGELISLERMISVVTKREEMWAKIQPIEPLNRHPPPFRRGKGSWDCIEGDFS